MVLIRSWPGAPTVRRTRALENKPSNRGIVARHSNARFVDTAKVICCGTCRLESVNRPMAVVAVRPFERRSQWAVSFGVGCTDPQLDSALSLSSPCSFSPAWDLPRGWCIYTHGGLVGSNTKEPDSLLLPPVRVRLLATRRCAGLIDWQSGV